MNLKNLKDEIIKKLKSAKYFDKLLFIYIFGSQAEDSARKDSDIDVCLYYDIKDKKKLYKLGLYLKGIFPKNFDISLFQFLPLPVRKEIFKGKLIYARDINFVYDVAFKTFEDFEEFRPRYLYYIRKNYEL